MGGNLLYSFDLARYTVWHLRGEVRFWRAVRGTLGVWCYGIRGGPVRGTLGGGGQYDVMESVAAKGGFEPTSKLTSKSAWGKI